MGSLDYDLCEVCRKEQAQSIPATFDGIHQNCPRCGEFMVYGSACSSLGSGIGDRKRALLSGWVRDQNNSGSVPMISTAVLENVLQRSAPPVADRAFALLREAERGLNELGASFNTNEPRFLSATYSSNFSDVQFLVRALKEQGLMDFVTVSGDCEILPAGHMKLDELRTNQGASSQCFIAMWFDSSLVDAYENGFQAGVFSAGYNPLRIDRHEHVNRIDDEIVRQINSSKFVVADFSGHRGGVYFEAGYALGRNIPVFWTCRRSDMGQLHFDIRQFNCIDWDSPSDLATRLAARIEAVLGPGPTKLN